MPAHHPAGERVNPDCTALRHLTASHYRVSGCRCPAAREAHRIDSKRRREHRNLPALVDGTGTCRRVRALTALGWSAAALGNRLGVSKSRVDQLRAHRHPEVLRETRDRIRALYETLSGTPGPSPAAARFARAQGWPPPLAWEYRDLDDPAATPHTDGPTADDRTLVDQVAVDEAARGLRPVRLTLTERTLAVHKARTLGVTAGETALRLGVTERTVQRILATRP